MSRRFVRTSATTLLVALALVLTFAPVQAATVTLSYASAISILSGGTAGTYPATLANCGLAGAVSNVEVTINGVFYLDFNDIEILLVGPTGASVILMSDVPGAGDFSSAPTFTFKDSASGTMPSDGTVATGTYKPTNLAEIETSYPSPAPAGPYGTTLAAFNGTNPNGVWSLYVSTDRTGLNGIIRNGWGLKIDTTGTTVQKCTPTLQVNPVTVTYGGTANVTATLTVGDTGVSGKTVTFTHVATTLGTALTDANGVATLSAASFVGVGAGSYPTGIGASFTGDSDYNAASDTNTLAVNKANTTTTITSDNPDPSVVGQSATVAYSVAVVAPGSGTPTGNITVSDGTVSCTGTVAAGQCTLTFTSAGAKTLTATYAGDANFNGSASAGAAHTVNKADTTTTITSDTPDPSVVGQSVTVAYSVAVTAPGGGTPGGNVTVSDGVNSCTGTVAAGSCSLALSTVGARTLTATYQGNTNFNASPASTGASHTVNKANTTTTITSDNPDPSIIDQAVTVAYSVAAVAPGSGTPTGNITVSDGTVSCTGTVAAGQCTLTFTSLGAKTLTATYAGDANFNGSTSATATHTVNKINTTTTITSDTPDPSVVGQAIAVTSVVAVTAPGTGTPTGTITVSDGSASCTITLPATSCNLTFTSAGAKTLAATYAGDANFNGSASAGAAHTVNKADTTTTITSDTPDPSVVGQSVTVAYSVAVTAPGSGTPTGNVTVSDGTVSCTGTVAAGQCTLTPTSAGAKTLAATYAGDANFNGSASAGAAHTVNKADTTTTITSDTPDPSVVGQSVTVAYSVAVTAPGGGTPGGNVTVSDGTVSCTGTVAAGQCMITFTSPGAKSLTATYVGDSNFNTSTSPNEPHTVNLASTATTIISDNPDPSVVGQTVTVVYSVTASPPSTGTPTGNVTVGDGTVSCTGTVAAGSCTLTFTSAGAKTLTAIYAGDSNFNGSASSGTAHIVNKATTTIGSLTDAPDPSVVGQSVTVGYTVAVSNPGAGTPTGTVTVTSGSDSCTATVAAGQCAIVFTSSGVKTVTVDYAGDSNFNSSTNTLGHQVNQAATTTMITSDTPDPSVVGEPVTVAYSVVVTAPGGGTPTGNVTVSDGTVSCTGTVAAGQCTLTFTSAGAKTLAATYAGDANFNGSASAGAAHTVNKADTTTTITSDTPDPSVVGQSVTVAYSVAVTAPGGGTPGGHVTVSDGTVSCTGTVAAGQCMITFTSPGAKSLTATYVGDSNFNTSTSPNEPHTVNKATTTTAITSDNPDPSVVGQPVTVVYSVAVSAPGTGTPTGNVTVSDGTNSCTATVAAGQCALTFTSPGAKTLTATYAGDDNFNGSASPGTTHTVNKADTTMNITSDNPDPSVVGEPITVAYSVTVIAPGAGTPTGTVTVSDGTISCTVTVATGACTLTFTSPGARTLTAAYTGDANVNGSTAPNEPHTVNKAATTTTIVSDNPDASAQGQVVTVVYSVAVSAPGAGTPTGNVTVGDGVDSCTATVAAGQCTVVFTTLGARTLVATYTGDSNFFGNTSASEPHTVVLPAALVTVPKAVASYGDASVPLTAGVTNPFIGTLSGGTVTFTVRKGGTIRTILTSNPVNGSSPATVTVILPLNVTWDAGNYTVEARYDGDPCCLAGTGSGTLSIQRRMLWVQAVDRTVGLYQPNPSTTPPANCLASATATSVCWLQLANGSSFVYGQSWSALNLANLRFTYSRNYPSSNASETVGKTYKISATGVFSTNYDIRYQQGTLTVVP